MGSSWEARQLFVGRQEIVSGKTGNSLNYRLIKSMF
jgi:hypothetical protein